MDKKENIRIQFDDFNQQHFDITAIWEFAVDEEGEDGQDETTLKPRFDLTIAEPSEVLLLVPCEFESIKGRKYYGFCSPSSDYDISIIQPYIFTDKGKVMFWYGMFQPEIDEKQEAYKALGETADSLFPLKFKSPTPTTGTKLEGQINGFMWLNVDDNAILTEK